MMLTCTSPATRVTTTIPNVHVARLPMLPKPTPRQRKSGRSGMPERRQEIARTTVCAMMPRVAVPPTSAIAEGVHQSTSFRWKPKRTMKRPNPAIETMLLTTGAQA